MAAVNRHPFLADAKCHAVADQQARAACLRWQNPGQGLSTNPRQLLNGGSRWKNQLNKTAMPIFQGHFLAVTVCLVPSSTWSRLGFRYSQTHHKHRLFSSAQEDAARVEANQNSAISSSVPKLAAAPIMPSPPSTLIPLPTSAEAVESSYGQSPEEREEELRKLLVLLPEPIRERLGAHEELNQLLEVVLDLGRRPMARFPSGDWNISEECVMWPDLDYALAQVGEFGGDNRAGIDRTLHRISAIRNRAGKVVGLTCRVGRAISGSAEMVRDLVASGCSLLLMGPPGVGKTTAIREVARLLADEHLRRVVIVDTSNEIGGDGDIPHPGIGRARRMQVPEVSMQHELMIEAVENHMPQTIVIDEIGTELEAMAAGTIAQRGVQLVGTAHGMTVDNLIKNPSLQNLAGGIQSVTLGDDEARRRGVQKSVLERKGPPVFTCAVEQVSRTEWRVHRSLAATVDSLLAGRRPVVEVRRMTDGGRFVVVAGDPDPGSAFSRGGRRGGAAKPAPFSYAAEMESEDEFSDMEYDSDAGGADVEKGYRARAELDDRAGDGGSAGEEEGEYWRRPGDGPLLLYTYQVAEAPLEQVMEVMGLESAVRLTASIGEADAVLALRSKLKQNAWLRGVAKYRHLPIYAIKSNTMAQMVRAMRTILEIDTLAPGLLPFQHPEGGFQDSSGVKGDDGEPRSRPAGSKASLEDEIDALEEARLAVEQIVIPRGQPVELLPRGVQVVELQVKFVEGYHLATERVGTAASCRIRILPGQLNQRDTTLAPTDVDGSTNEEGAIESDAASGLTVNRLPVLEDFEV